MAKNQRLNLGTLGLLGNGAGELVINSALRQAILDTDDRGQDGKERKVTVTVSLKKQKTGVVEIGLTANFSPPKYVVLPTAANFKVDGISKQTVLELDPAGAGVEDESEVLA